MQGELRSVVLAIIGAAILAPLLGRLRRISRTAVRKIARVIVAASVAALLAL
ncbi:MAG TPA: hypothetical protein VFG91_12835 [Woeseiaceae bacterium]|nr:hypothetical protein [Woeseiaceae bacterium]